MKGKFMKKLTAYALVAAMAVSTPMTAFASGFADNFEVSEGEDKGTNTKSATHTGTNTSTNSTTNTNTATLPDNETKIKGIKISPESSVMNVGEEALFEAEVLYEDEDTTSDENKESIKNLITWQISDDSIVAVVDSTEGSRDKCLIKARKAGLATITAGFDLNNDGVDDYLTSAEITVKRDITKIEWDVPEDKLFYAGHTYDLHDYILVNGELAEETDDITFAIMAGDPKFVKVDGNGILTVDKKTTGGTFKVIAEYKDGLSVTVTSEPKELNLSAGDPVTKITVTNWNRAGIDIANAYDKITHEKNGAAEETATIQVTTKSGKITTDEIEWTSSNEKVARIGAVKNNGNNIIAEIEGVSVGRAKITIAATSGRKASFNVTVKATLIAIDEISINETNTTWSGKTTPVILKRVPAENVDKIKIDIQGTDKKFVKAKNTNIVPAADLTKTATPGMAKVTIQAVGGTKNSPVTSGICEVTVQQSNVFFESIVREGGIDVNRSTERLNPDGAGTYYATGIRYYAPMASVEEAAGAISWESSKESVATIDNGRLNVVGEGTAKITVSSVYKDARDKYRTVKKAFTVKSTPKCEEIILKSNTAANIRGERVTFNVKQQLPKKAADKIIWYVNGKQQTDSRLATDKKLTYTINTNDIVVDEQGRGIVKVLATTGSVSTEATIYVVSPAAKVIVPDAYKRGMTLNAGEMKIMEVPIVEPKSGSVAEPIVRYDVDKKGATVVKVLKLSDGTVIVYGIGTGKATISAVTASGKSAKIKVTVN